MKRFKNDDNTKGCLYKNDLHLHNTTPTTSYIVVLPIMQDRQLPLLSEGEKRLKKTNQLLRTSNIKNNELIHHKPSSVLY